MTSDFRYFFAIFPLSFYNNLWPGQLSRSLRPPAEVQLGGYFYAFNYSFNSLTNRLNRFTFC